MNDCRFDVSPVNSSDSDSDPSLPPCTGLCVVSTSMLTVDLVSADRIEDNIFKESKEEVHECL